ncbi:ABC transporter permease [Streptomyces sp. NPDC005336]|uniref:ABC transporter permease n=1 Tax=Streptomyces sp. NPDC005336 TaxID=3157035 RepID=UPI0033B5FA10
MKHHSSKRHWTLFATATRYALTEHLRNRFAMVLVAVFIPVWTAFAFLSVPSTKVPFQLRATGEPLTPGGNQLTEITGALNAVTLIIGFMMFAAAFSSGHFDRRLAMAGYPRTHLILAKITSLTPASGVVALYATAFTCMFRVPDQPILFTAALFCAGLTYGALGVAFGSLLRREVEGMFAIVMISVMDLALQNPLYSSGSDSPIVRYLPAYGAMQASTGAAFSSTPLTQYLAIQLLWFAAAALVGLLSFHRRTRTTLPAFRQPQLIPHQQPETVQQPESTEPLA